MEDVRLQAVAAPCGNFSAVYQCMCDYHGVDFMEDVAWVSLCSFCRNLSCRLFVVFFAVLVLVGTFTFCCVVNGKRLKVAFISCT